MCTTVPIPLYLQGPALLSNPFSSIPHISHPTRRTRQQRAYLCCSWQQVRVRAVLSVVNTGNTAVGVHFPLVQTGEIVNNHM